MENHFHKEVALTRLGAGQFFGEIELMQGGQAVAHVRACEQGAELVLIPKRLFFELIDGSPVTRSALNDAATRHKTEHERRKSRQ